MSALVDLGPRLVPVTIRHARLGLAWRVRRVLEDWTTPPYYDAVGTPAETRRFRVCVSGPLPGSPSEEGEFIMTVRRYGDRPAGGSARRKRAQGQARATASNRVRPGGLPRSRDRVYLATWRIVGQARRAG
jgi:hypothetical protein